MISVERHVDDDERDVDLKLDDLEPEDGLCGQEQQTGGGRLCKTIVDGCIIYIISTCMVSLRKKDKRNNNKF